MKRKRSKAALLMSIALTGSFMEVALASNAISTTTEAPSNGGFIQASNPITVTVKANTFESQEWGSIVASDGSAISIESLSGSVANTITATNGGVVSIADKSSLTSRNGVKVGFINAEGNGSKMPYKYP